MVTILLAVAGFAVIAQLYWLISALISLGRRRFQIHARRPRPYRVISRTNHDANVFSITVEPVGHKLRRFKSGQYLTIVGPLMKSGMPSERRYSIDRWDKNPRTFGLTIKRETLGMVSGWLHETAEIGAQFFCRPPAGDFILPNSRGQHRTVLVAAGVGITPMRAMLHQMLAGGFANGEVGLFYSGRTRSGLPFHEEFEGIAATQDAFYYHPTLTTEDMDWSGDRGRITADMLFAFGGLRANYLLCASAPMIETLMDGLRRLGIPESQLHHELFGGSAGICGKHVLTVNGADVDVEGYPSLLAAMEANAVPISADCRAGHCGVCRRKVFGGEILHSSALAFDLKDGECLPCIAISLSNVALDPPIGA